MSTRMHYDNWRIDIQNRIKMAARKIGLDVSSFCRVASLEKANQVLSQEDFTSEVEQLHDDQKTT